MDQELTISDRIFAVVIASQARWALATEFSATNVDSMWPLWTSISWSGVQGQQKYLSLTRCNFESGQLSRLQLRTQLLPRQCSYCRSEKTDQVCHRGLTWQTQALVLVRLRQLLAATAVSAAMRRADRRGHGIMVGDEHDGLLAELAWKEEEIDGTRQAAGGLYFEVGTKDHSPNNVQEMVRGVFDLLELRLSTSISNFNFFISKNRFPEISNQFFLNWPHLGSF